MDDSFYTFDAPKYRIPDDRSLGLQDPLSSDLLGSGGQSDDDVEIEEIEDVKDQDTFYTGPFAIKINGSYQEDEDGVVSQSSSFNVTVESGTAKYPNASAITIGAESDSVNANNGMTTVYASVKGTRNDADGPVDTYSDGTIHIDEAPTAAAGSNTRYETDNNRDYIFTFLIGTVTVSKNSDDKWVVKVNQIQVGNYEYGEQNGTDSDDNGNDTRGGPRQIIFCLNGLPYYADVEMTNIVAV